MLSINYTLASIAGVTFMDHFDFESRYRNDYECDPLYWHPLHLPEHCVEMYLTLITSRLAAAQPLHVMRPVDDYSTKFKTNIEYIDPPRVAPRRRKSSLMDNMMSNLYSDILNRPVSPMIGYSGTGPALIYTQPISKKSEQLIKYFTSKHNNDQQWYRPDQSQEKTSYLMVSTNEQ